jgi:hypothetical protein
VTTRQREPRDDRPAEEQELEGPAFQDEVAGRVTLTLGGPPLELPRELLDQEPVVAPRNLRSEPHHLDAWSADRLRRSSLPPSAESSAAVSVFPPTPANDAAAERMLGDEGSDLLNLVSRARPMQALDLVTEMTERFSLGDFSGALRAAELLLGQQPDHELGQHYARESRAKLEDMYTSRLGGARPLQVAVPQTDIAWLGLDPHVAALLAQVDGESDYEAVLAQSSMPRLAALRALVDLLEARVIRLV